MKKLLLIVSLSLAPALTQAATVAFETSRDLPIVNLSIAVREGAASDPDGQVGISHFVGEMLLRGTKKLSKEQIDLALDQMGARLAVETRSEALILRGAVLESELDNYLDLVKQIITEPSFPDNEIKKLKGETISTILAELGKDQTLAGRKFFEYLFSGHPYGKPLWGKTKDIEKLTKAQVQKHYDRLFQTKKMVILGSGSTTEEKIQKWVASISQARPEGDAPMLVELPKEVAKRQLLIVDKPDRTQTQILAGQIGVKMTDADYFPLYLANHVYGGGSFQTRLMSEIRVKRGWSYGAYSVFRHARQPRSWNFYLFPKSKDTPEALAFSLKMVEDLRQKGISKEEFEFGKQSLVNSAGFMYNTPEKRMENKMLELTTDLPEGFIKSYADKIDALSIDQVNKAVSKFWKPERLSVLVLCTAKELKDQVVKNAGVAAEDVKVVAYTED
jgi:zinc protease